MVNYFRRLEADGQIFTRRKPIRLIWQLPPEKALAATGYRKYVIVRNPFTRVLSAFRQRNGLPGYFHYPGLSDRTPKGFAEFIGFLDAEGLRADKHWTPIVDQLTWPVEDFDYILHLENISSEFQKMLQIEKLRLPKRQDVSRPHRVDRSRLGKITSSASQTARYYTSDLEKTVARLYEEDFSAFGYPTTLGKMSSG
jgi:hypothetical protein